jgi:maltose alpha-D-glucosyltransferase/alpha-amylase
MDINWYRNAVFYSLDVETFQDSNGDGIGDFNGLIKRLEYIASLGVSCIWLLPFYPSPNRDNGYDVKDYYNVDERLGTLKEFSSFMEKAGELGLRVLIDLVVNHTSREHPWFQAARKDPRSRYRDFYIWSDHPQEYEREHLMLVGEEDTMWTFDEEAGQYYLHRFYKEQPDLNIGSPHVRKEILKIIEFWLGLGVSGFRIDAAEMLIETYGMKESQVKDLAVFLDEMRAFTTNKNPQALLLAEVNAPPDKMIPYLKEGKRMQMLFNFFINQQLFLSLAQEKGIVLEEALKALPERNEGEQWLNFLRHHDELSLKLIAEDTRPEIFQSFAPEENMRSFGHGIRRRLAPMMNGDLQKIKLAYSLLFSIPGVPLVRYGEEIGMGRIYHCPAGPVSGPQCNGQMKSMLDFQQRLFKAWFIL